MYSQSENTNYYIKFPYTDKKNKPLKIWENLNEILEVNNISVMYNEIAKDIEIKGVEGSTLESQLIAIHSLSNKSGLPLSLNMINNFINKIANNVMKHMMVRRNTFKCYVMLLLQIVLLMKIWKKS